jgi:hypothetical protein
MDEQRVSLDVRLLAPDELAGFGAFFNDVKLAVADLIGDSSVVEVPPL